MWLQFFSQDSHFAIYLFAALSCIAVAWLYADAWLVRKTLREYLKLQGFALLGLAFLLQATTIEQTVLGQSIFGAWGTAALVVFKIIAFGSIIASQLIDPLQAVPKLKGLELGEEQKPTKKSSNSKNKRTPIAFIGSASLAFKWLVPIGGFATAYLYWRRATTGLERHLKQVAYAFMFISVSELLHIAGLLRDNASPILSSLVSPFGWVWWIELLSFLFGIVLLSRWVWSYLTERFFSQLFMVFVSMAVVIFLVVSVGFTSLLLRETRANMAKDLDTAVHVLEYALVAKQAETTSAAEQLASNSSVITALSANDHDSLAVIAKDFLVQKKQTLLIITNQDGMVLLRGHDPAYWGDSLSSEPGIRRALLNENRTTVSVTDGTIIPTVEARSVVAVKNSNGSIIGTVTTGVMLDTAFVDGLQNSTGLQSSVYGRDILVATTLVSPDGVTRATGTLLSESDIKKQVLSDGNTYTGELKIQHRELLGAILPLKDTDNEPVGMLMVSRPQSDILRNAAHAVNLTFILTAGLFILSIYPAFLITKNLTKQLK